ncbi:hypothetical protein C8A00DRAFT_40636 [Chaetomidium leptoderma]|uniref:F-box domain-containing protein n=1 Tax=Chaetomidium leptoderma TaxID=669021 RepID=A0AAN6VVH6_9PEZI|nr:hypothetical protein C8A00DRAFT_40636 [Chaetomidium leptoderma]
MRDITELPHDLFLLVISYLSPHTCVRARAVSRRWHVAFTDEAISLLLLRWNFPRCRELRLATAAVLLSPSSSSSPSPASSIGLRRNLRAELADVAEQPRNWSSTFAKVTRRYFNLNKGQPHVVEKLELAVSRQENGSGFSFWGVAPWVRFLRLNDKTSSFHYPDPVWWYSQEDGVLVFPAAATDADDDLPPDRCDGHVYRILDLSSGQKVPVPFDVRSKHIRRVRLAQGVLIIEWAEALPYHQLNDREAVHRHFVTAFDVIRKPVATTTSGRAWTVEFRSEWKLHFLGLPLNSFDRFLSAHTATHYAVYFWQPNRSLSQHDPVEQLAVWDISTPSTYRPSEDPKGDKRPAATTAPSLPTGLWSGQSSTAADSIYGLTDSSAELERPTRASLATATAGPQVIRRIDWRALDFYGLRQRTTPHLRCLALDAQNLYVIEEEHRWAGGQHRSLDPPRAHLVRSTGIPVVPMPIPSTQAAAYPIAARPTTDLSAGADQLDPKLATLSSVVDEPIVNGPMWVDSCGANGNVNMNFCRRVADANGTSKPTHGVWLAPPRGTGLEHLDDQPQPQSSSDAVGWPWALGETNSPNPVFSTESTRWPGWAPCWRHEDFPYLTVAEMVDFAAGVRVTARHGFILETMSVHIRPAVAVRGAAPATADEENGEKSAKRRSSKTKAVAARSKEVYFPDEMWSELVSKGYIAGDERWIVGEDEKGRITVLEEFSYVDPPPYAVLSHTWGSDSEEVSYHDVLNGRLNSPTARPPKVTGCCKEAKVDGYQYVWIDTCCIDKTNSVELQEAINSMFHLCDLVEAVTGIPTSFLLGITELYHASVAQRMSWAAKRVTKRKEDISYSLLGIFGVSMPMIYGEGDKAFRRLQEHVMKDIGDDSILAWDLDSEGLVSGGARGLGFGAALAPAPSHFANSGQERMVGVPLVAVPGGEPNNYFRPEGGRAAFVATPGFGVSTTSLIHIQLGVGPKSRSNVAEACWFHIRKSVPNLELIGVHPAASWHKERALIEAAVEPTGGGVRRILARFRETVIESADFVAVLEVDSQAQPCCNIMVASRETSLEEIANHSNAWEHIVMGRACASNRVLNLGMALETIQASASQRNFILKPFAVSEAPCITINATTSLQFSEATTLLGQLRQIDKAQKREEKELLDLLETRRRVLAQQHAQLETVRAKIKSLEQEERRLAEKQGLIQGVLLPFAAKNRERSVRSLIRRAASVTATDLEGKTALHHAVQQDREELVRLLIDKGAHVSSPDMNGFTPIHSAAGGGFEGITRLLLEKGASPSETANCGSTPLDLAIREGHDHIIALLKSHKDE